MTVCIRAVDNPPTTEAQLCVAVQKDWVTLRPVRLRTLVRSMPRRVRAILAAGGGHTYMYY